MDANTTSRLLQGLAVKLIGISIAVWVAVTVANYVTDVFAQVETKLEQVRK